MSDPRIAALAEALHGVICSTLDDFGSHRPGDPAFMCDPVDILAALDAAGWTLVEKRESVRDVAARHGINVTDHGLPPEVVRPAPFPDDYPGAEIAGLRKIEEAARRFMTEEIGWIGDRPYYIYVGRPAVATVAALRAALKEKETP